MIFFINTKLYIKYKNCRMFYSVIVIYLLYKSRTSGIFLLSAISWCMFWLLLHYYCNLIVPTYLFCLWGRISILHLLGIRILWTTVFMHYCNENMKNNIVTWDTCQFYSLQCKWQQWHHEKWIKLYWTLTKRQYYAIFWYDLPVQVHFNILVHKCLMVLKHCLIHF